MKKQRRRFRKVVKAAMKMGQVTVRNNRKTTSRSISQKHRVNQKRLSPRFRNKTLNDMYT